MIFIAFLLFGVIVIIILPTVINDIITKSFVENTKNTIVLFVVNEIKGELKKDDFNSQNYINKQTTFSEFFHNMKISGIVTINLWSSDGIIIYSPQSYFVGKNFVENPGFQKAISGMTVSEINPEVHEGFPTETIGKENMMEIYAPIKFDSDVAGVAEIYVKLTPLEKTITETNLLIIQSFSIFIISGVFLFIILHLIIRKSIITPLTKIQSISGELSKGNFNIRADESRIDELGDLAKSFNMMIQNIKKLQTDLIKSERLSAIGELSTRLAHDLKNPLSVIRNAIDIIKLENHNLDEKTIMHLDKANHAISRMSHQIDDVLDFIMPKPLTFTKVSLLQVLKTTLERITMPDLVNVKLPQNDFEIMGDPDKLGHLFSNLIKNAIQAMNNKGEINIRITDQKDDVLIEVEDTGPGIPDEILPKIFVPLFTTKQTGTGLGLSSCKNIIEQHGGTIDVKTAIGRGATFILKLPKTN